MIIRKLRMVNFRGFCDKTIDFDVKPVVLISAANGIGKTTTIDAIEWCLTGEIGRLKTAFDTRSTNDTDRKKNTNGILKNRNSGNTSKVQVFLWIVDGENEIILCREQKKDELNPDASKVTIDGSEEEAKGIAAFDQLDASRGDTAVNTEPRAGAEKLRRVGRLQLRLGPGPHHGRAERRRHQ